LEKRCEPSGFDFAVWNAAWPDQQVDTLQGDEVLELTNLSAPRSPASRRDAKGQTLLRLQLPAHSVRLFIRLQSGEMFAHPMHIDTLMVEPDTQSLTLVWRCVLAKDPELPIRAVEAQVLDAQRTQEAARDLQRALDALDRWPPKERQPEHKQDSRQDSHQEQPHG
jgi:hypothetical protein